MRKAIATVSLSGTLIEKLEAIAAARFDGVEIFENDLLPGAALGKAPLALLRDLRPVRLRDFVELAELSIIDRQLLLVVGHRFRRHGLRGSRATGAETGNHRKDT